MINKAISVSIKQKKEDTLYTVKWEELVNEHMEERQCKSTDFPRPELDNTLTALGEYIPDMCCIIKDQIRFLEVAGGTFEYTKVGTFLTLGVAISLKNGKSFDFRSPATMVNMKMQINKATTPEERFSALAAMLHDEILLYAQGQRAQTTLGLEGWTAEVIEDEEGGGQDGCVDEESTE